MKKRGLVIFFMFAVICTNAQQLQLSTNYVLNNYAYNPAIAGFKPHSVVNLNYRNQWVGFQDAPKTYLLSIHNSVGKENKVGLGFFINSENTGLLSKTSSYVTFAYHLKLNNQYKISFGISAGMLQYRIKLYDAKIADAGDDLLTGNLLTNNVFDSNAGFYLYSDKLFFGISSYQYLFNKITWKDSRSSLTPHFYSTIGYSIRANKNLVLQPSALVKFNYPALIQPEISVRGIYKRIFWLGTSYRVNDALNALVGIIVKEKLTIAFAYDYTTSKIKNYTKGSNEVSISYQFIKKKKKLNADEEEFNDIDNSIRSKLKKQNEEELK
jgi:type IX secretion system PorP/SprF family membrane protein